MNKIFKYISVALLAMTVASCADDPKTPEPEGIKVEGAENCNSGGFTGFYLLNEGNMGSNKCTLDYFSYVNGTYTRNIYAAANPDQILELGDVGNDMAIYDDKLFIVVNGSNKVEVLDAATAKHIAKVDIASPRSIAFYGNLAFVTSFVGGEGDNGTLVAFDIYSFKVVGKVSVGRMPEGVAVLGKKLYVANSGDYTNSAYKNYISVVDVMSLHETAKIDGPINMQHITFDPTGHIWASSRGNYVDKASCLVRFTATNGTFALSNTVEKAVSNMSLGDKKLLFIGSTYDANWNATYNYNTISFSGNDFTEGGSFITDGTEADIETPYALAVNPNSGEIYITDVKNYVSSGTVRCYSKDGKLLWKADTGDVPGHIVFYRK